MQKREVRYEAVHPIQYDQTCHIPLTSIFIAIRYLEIWFIIIALRYTQITLEHKK